MSEYDSTRANSVKVHFYETVADEKLKFAVIAARYRSKWVFCKHKERNTYEIPGGHRECGETIDDAARRELYEETGATDFELTKVCVYSAECISDKSEPLQTKYNFHLA